MRDTDPLLHKTDFPALRRSRLGTLQANPGYRCNLTILNEPGHEDLADLLDHDLNNTPIRVAGHC